MYARARVFPPVRGSAAEGPICGYTPSFTSRAPVSLDLLNKLTLFLRAEVKFKGKKSLWEREITADHGRVFECPQCQTPTFVHNDSAARLGTP